MSSLSAPADKRMENQGMPGLHVSDVHNGRMSVVSDMFSVTPLDGSPSVLRGFLIS